MLKRFGAGNPGPLSFPMGGWTLAIDVATDRAGLAELLRGLDELVLDAGGRHYLAKDFHISRDGVRRGYPRLDEWQAIRAPGRSRRRVGQRPQSPSRAHAVRQLTHDDGTMQNALHEPQTIVLLGGTSEIGRAIVDELLSAVGARRWCWPAAAPTRRNPTGSRVTASHVVVEHFDAADTEHARRVRAPARRRARRPRRRHRGVRCAR